MSSIITITLNPAIDKSTSIAVLAPDKKMKCTVPVFEPGGGGVNVARAIKKLGGHATAIYLAGGYSGKFFKQLLDREQIESNVIEIEEHTRENLIVLDKSINKQYRFGMPGPSIRETEWKQLLSWLENTHEPAFIIASGSVPAGVPADIFARIAEIAQKKRSKFVLDTSGEALRQGVNKGVYLLKPNLGELSFLAGKEWLKSTEVEEVAIELINKGKCEVIVVSMGEAGAMLLTRDVTKKIVPPAMERKSTVGAGDSMLAGIVLRLSQGKSITEAARFGVASGTAATMNPGTELCRKEDAEMIYEKINLS